MLKSLSERDFAVLLALPPGQEQHVMSNTHVMMPLASPLPWLDPLLVAELLAEKITGIPVDETDAQESETGQHLAPRSHPLPRLPAYVGATSRLPPAVALHRWALAQANGAIQGAEQLRLAALASMTHGACSTGG